MEKKKKSKKPKKQLLEREHILVVPQDVSTSTIVYLYFDRSIAFKVRRLLLMHYPKSPAFESDTLKHRKTPYHCEIQHLDKKSKSAFCKYKNKRSSIVYDLDFQGLRFEVNKD
jgi:hypothetical protein